MSPLHAFPRIRLAALWALVLCAVAGPAVASGEDHEQARQAVESGQILPLSRVLERLARDQPGQVLELELEREGGVWLYEVKLLQPDGRLLKLHLDARSGAPWPKR